MPQPLFVCPKALQSEKLVLSAPAEDPPWPGCGLAEPSTVPGQEIGRALLLQWNGYDGSLQDLRLLISSHSVETKRTLAGRPPSAGRISAAIFSS